jgi:hypothetical protein
LFGQEAKTVPVTKTAWVWEKMKPVKRWTPGVVKIEIFLPGTQSHSNVSLTGRVLPKLRSAVAHLTVRDPDAVVTL